MRRVTIACALLLGCAGETEPAGTDLSTGAYDLLLVPHHGINGVGVRFEAYRGGHIEGHRRMHPEEHCVGEATLEMQDELTRVLEEIDVVHLESPRCIDCLEWELTIASDRGARTFERVTQEPIEPLTVHASGAMTDLSLGFGGSCGPPSYVYP